MSGTHSLEQFWRNFPEITLNLSTSREVQCDLLLKSLIWGTGEFQKESFTHPWENKSKATLVRVQEVESMELDRETCIEKEGKVETTWAGVMVSDILVFSQWTL